jgi:O-acetylhomoserine (thiol)-lyase
MAARGRFRGMPLRNMGAAIAPMNSFLILQGIETLPLRMDRICENSVAIAKHLQSHAKVASVNYAGLPDHPDHGLVQKYMGSVVPYSDNFFATLNSAVFSDGSFVYIHLLQTIYNNF